MKTFNQFLIEAKSLVVYHGDNYGTKKLDPKLMMQDSGNNQEGVGIYFTNLPETAKHYGNKVVQATINPSKLLDSRDPLKKIPSARIIKLLNDMWKVDNEEMFYFLSDYVEVTEPSEVKPYHFSQVYSEYMKEGEIRNFQIDIAEKFGVENFVASWNKNVKIDGLYHKQNDNDTWYALINTSIKVEPFK